jgi:hypothetical protein
LKGFPIAVQSSAMLFRGRHAPETIEVRTSDLLERIQRIEAEQAALRAEIESDRQLRFLTTEIVGVAQAAPIIGNAIENFAQAMRRQLPRGRAGGIARASSAWRYFDGTFMPESEKDVAHREEYERFAAGGRARARGARRFADGSFAPNHE